VSDTAVSAVARARGLLARMSERDARTSSGGLRASLRWMALRALSPYTAYQRQVDAALMEALQSMLAHQQEIADALGQLSERSGSIGELVQDLVATVDANRERMRRTTDALGGEVEWLVGLRRDLYATPYVDGDPFSSFTAPVGEVTGYRELPVRTDPGSPYAGFEDLFRGPAERVSELQRPYLPLVAEHQPVLDVGCGRGEFLSLLAAEGIAGRGVDSDPGMAERCRAQGLEVELADGIAYLEALDDASLGTVFCAQVIEHLPVDQLRRLLEAARRTLVPGGLFIAETVNPHSLPGMKTFWTDLTHQHPIFPEVALAMCGLAGFVPAYVFSPGDASFEAVRFTTNTYAVVATAPEATG
jgi:SAM-dependent methyltransferase